jgi:hypothetical protein
VREVGPRKTMRRSGNRIKNNFSISMQRQRA